MKLLTLSLFLGLCLNVLADLQSHTQKLSPEIRKQILMVGRLGLTEIWPTISLGEEGHLLAPEIESIDGSDTPYILYHRNGTRQPLELIATSKRYPVVILKLPEGVEVARTFPASKASTEKFHWVYHPTLSPAPVLGEPAAIVLGTRHKLKEPKETLFAVSLPSLKAGSPILDLNGDLLGISLPARRRDDSQFTRALYFSRLAEDLEQFHELKSSENTSVHFPIPENRPNHPSVGLVINEGKQLTYSVAGTIIREDGLILTKASELGPQLSFKFENKTYPAVLLATDAATDLALIGITAKKLPVISWSDPAMLKTGSLLHHQSLLDKEDPEMGSMNLTSLGTFTVQLPGNPISIHHSSRGTSLGIVPEQLQNHLVISAILTGSPARKMDLRLGDKLLKIEDTTITNRTSLARFLAGTEVGQEVKLTIEREGVTSTLSLPLIAASLAPESTGITINEPQTCVPSVVRGPFPSSLAHTLSLNSWDCGAPLLDFQNRAYGLHIAAITPTRGLALPPSSIQEAITRMMTSINF